MSLNVSSEIVEAAEKGRVDQAAFVRVISESLPKAWAIVEGLVKRQGSSEAVIEAYGSGPMDEECRGQLLRMLAGTAIRSAVERHFGMTLVFQNCHNVAVVKEGEEESEEVKEFTSPEAQVKGQKPEYQHC